MLLVIAVFVIFIFEFVSRLGVASEDFGSHHFVSQIAISPLLPRCLALGGMGALELASLYSVTYACPMAPSAWAPLVEIVSLITRVLPSRS